MGTLWQPHPTQDQPSPAGGFGIDSRIDADALRAPAASKENSRPQAILKFQPRNSFDYRVHYEPQLSTLYKIYRNIYIVPIDFFHNVKNFSVFLQSIIFHYHFNIAANLKISENRCMFLEITVTSICLQFSYLNLQCIRGRLLFE